MPLRFKSDMDASGFENGIQRMDHAATHLSEKLRRIGENLGAGFLVGGVTLGLHELLEGFTKIRNESSALSLDPEQFQRLSLAFVQSGASSEEFTKGFAMVIQKLEDARQKGGAAADAFIKLGISQKQIDTGSTLDNFYKIADALHESGGASREFGAAMDLFGSRLGVHIIPAMMRGSDAIKEIGKNAKVAANEVVESAHEMEVALNKFMTERKATLGANLYGLSEAAKIGADQAEKMLGEGYFQKLAGGIGNMIYSLFDPKGAFEGADISVPKADLKSLQDLKNQKGIKDAGASATVTERKRNEALDRAEKYTKRRMQWEKEAESLMHRASTQRIHDDAEINRLEEQANEIRHEAFLESLTDEQRLKEMESDRRELVSAITSASEVETAELAKQIAQLDVKIAKERKITQEQRDRAAIAKQMEEHGHLDPALTRTNIHEERRRAREEYLRSRRFGGSALADMQSGLSSGGMGHATRGMTAREKALGRLPATIMAQIDPKSIKDLTDEIERLIAK